MAWTPQTQVDPKVIKTEKDIAETKQTLQQQEQEIKTAKQEAKAPIQFTQAQLRQLTPTQRKQIKGQRITNIKQIAKAEAKWKPQAAAVRKQIAQTESQITTYRAQVKKAQQQEKDFYTAMRSIDNGTWTLQMMFGRPGVKAAIKELRRSGYQDPDEMARGVYPSSYIDRLQANKEIGPAIEEYIKTASEAGMGWQDIKFEISQAYGASYSGAKTTTANIPSTTVTPELEKAQVNLKDTKGVGTQVSSVVSEITKPTVPTTTPTTAPTPITVTEDKGYVSFNPYGDTQTLKEATGGKYFLEGGKIKSSTTGELLSPIEFETIWKKDYATDVLKQLGEIEEEKETFAEKFKKGYMKKDEETGKMVYVVPGATLEDLKPTTLELPPGMAEKLAEEVKRMPTYEPSPKYPQIGKITTTETGEVKFEIPEGFDVSTLPGPTYKKVTIPATGKETLSWADYVEGKRPEAPELTPVGKGIVKGGAAIVGAAALPAIGTAKLVGEIQKKYGNDIKKITDTAGNLAKTTIGATIAVPAMIANLQIDLAKKGIDIAKPKLEAAINNSVKVAVNKMQKDIEIATKTADIINQQILKPGADYLKPKIEKAADLATQEAKRRLQNELIKLGVAAAVAKKGADTLNTYVKQGTDAAATVVKRRIEDDIRKIETVAGVAAPYVERGVQFAGEVGKGIFEQKAKEAKLVAGLGYMGIKAAEPYVKTAGEAVGEFVKGTAQAEVEKGKILFGAGKAVSDVISYTRDLGPEAWVAGPVIPLVYGTKKKLEEFPAYTEWTDKQREKYLKEQVVVGFNEYGEPIKMSREAAMTTTLPDMTDYIKGKQKKEGGEGTITVVGNWLEDLQEKLPIATAEQLNTASTGILAEGQKRPFMPNNLFGILPSWSEIKDKKMEIKETADKWDAAITGYESAVKSHNELIPKWEEEITKFDKEKFIPAAKEIADGEFTDEEYNNFVKLSEERNEILDKWIPKLEASEKSLDNWTNTLETFDGAIVRDNSGRVISIKEPEVQIGVILSEAKGKEPLKVPLSKVKDETLIGFTKTLITSFFGREVGELYGKVVPGEENVYSMEFRRQVGTYVEPPKKWPAIGREETREEKVLDTRVKVPFTETYIPFIGDKGYGKEIPIKVDSLTTKEVGRVFEFAYDVAPYLVSEAVIPIEFGAKLIETETTKGKYGGPTGAVQYIKQHPVESIFAVAIGADIVSKWFKPTISGVGTTLPKGKEYGKEWYKAHRGYVSKGQEAYVTTPWREFWRQKPLYRASDYAKLQKTNPKMLARITDVLRGKRAVYDPGRYLFGKYPAQAPSEAAVTKFLKFKTDPFLIGRPATAAELAKGVKAGWTTTPVKETEFIRYQSQYAGKFGKQYQIYAKAESVPKGLEIGGKKVLNIKALSKEAGPGELLRNSLEKVSTRNVYQLTPQITSIQPSAIQFYKTGKEIPAFMRGTKVLSKKPLYVFEKTYGTGGIFQTLKGEKIPFQQTYKFGETYLGGTLQRKGSEIQGIVNAKRLQPYIGYQQILDGKATTKFATFLKTKGPKLKISYQLSKSKVVSSSIAPRTDITDLNKIGFDETRLIETSYYKPEIVTYGKTKTGYETFADDLAEVPAKITQKPIKVLRSRELINSDISKLSAKRGLIELTGTQVMGGIEVTTTPTTPRRPGESFSEWTRRQEKIQEEARKQAEKFEKERLKKLYKEFSGKPVTSSTTTEVQAPTPSYVGGEGVPTTYSSSIFGNAPLTGSTVGTSTQTITAPPIDAPTQIIQSLISQPIQLTPSITATGVAAKTLNVIKPSLVAISPSVLETKQDLFQVPEVAQVTITKTTAAPRVEVITQPKTKTEVISKTATTTVTETEIITPPKTVTPTKPTQPTKPTTVEVPTVRLIPSWLPDFGTEKKEKKKLIKKVKEEEGYNTWIKESKKRKYIRANINPITKKQAKDLGANIVDTTLGATFKIKKAGKPAKKPRIKIPKGYYERTKNKYRDFKLVKGKKKPLTDKWIEKKSRRLDTPTEVRKITALAKISKMKNDAGFGIKKAKPFSVKSPKLKTKVKFLK